MPVQDSPSTSHTTPFKPLKASKSGEGNRNKISDYKKTTFASVNFNATQFWKLFGEAVRVQLYFSFLALCMLAMFLCYSLTLCYKFYKSKSQSRILGLIAIGLIALAALKCTSRKHEYDYKTKHSEVWKSRLRFWQHPREENNFKLGEMDDDHMWRRWLRFWQHQEEHGQLDDDKSLNWLRFWQHPEENDQLNVDHKWIDWLRFWQHPEEGGHLDDYHKWIDWLRFWQHPEEGGQLDDDHKWLDWLRFWQHPEEGGQLDDDHKWLEWLKFWQHPNDVRMSREMEVDPKLREIIKWHKMFAIPMEMKRPPQFLVYLMDYFLHR